MRWRRSVLVLALVPAIASGCGDDHVATGEIGSSSAADSESGGTSATSADPSSGSAAADSTGAPAGTDGPQPEPLPLASGIRLLRIAANQGVQVELVADGVEIPGDAYGAHIVAHRRTLLRGFWSLHAQFEPRELIGRLTVEYPDGTTLEQDYSIFVDGESGDAGKSFQWLLEPDQVVDGLRFRARVLEPDAAAATGELSDPPPVAPLSGFGTLAAYDVPLRMEVVLVPVLHQLGDCEQAPQVGDADVTAMRQQLEQANPVQSANVTVREPMPYTDSIGEKGSFSDVLTALAQARELDAPAPNVYYYGLVDSCDGYPPGLLGQAIGIPPEPLQELAHQRVSAGRWNGSGEAAAETFVHEVGHTQGRRHVRCSGGEAGVDAAYPHPGGRIGVWGFGIHDFQLRTPTGGRDYMTYCSNEWVSDYGWEQTLAIIETLTAWDEQGAPSPSGAVLMGAIEPDGRATWWTARGGVPASVVSPEGPRVVARAPGGGTTRADAWVYIRPDSDTVQVVAPLPVAFDRAVALELAIPGEPARSIDMASIRRLHDR
jgi:hypothetical protein